MNGELSEDSHRIRPEIQARPGSRFQRSTSRIHYAAPIPSRWRRLSWMTAAGLQPRRTTNVGWPENGAAICHSLGVRGHERRHPRREWHDGCMTATTRWIAVGSLSVLCATCSAAPASSSAAGSPTDVGITGLRAAAMAWSHAFLTGTVADIRNMEGAPCRSVPIVSPTVVKAYLKGMRAELQHYLGTPLRSIRITGVRTRNVTATTGGAEVKYALPASVVGNDDWVSYGYQHGKWKVTNCHAPIGGESSSSSSSATSSG
jgi:hypothetical protein